MFVFIFVEGGHQFLEIILSADRAHKLGGEVGVHARAVPVDVFSERLAVEMDIHSILFADPHEEVAAHPHFVGGFL